MNTSGSSWLPAAAVAARSCNDLAQSLLEVSSSRRRGSAEAGEVEEQIFRDPYSGQKMLGIDGNNRRNVWWMEEILHQLDRCFIPLFLGFQPKWCRIFSIHSIGNSLLKLPDITDWGHIFWLKIWRSWWKASQVLFWVVGCCGGFIQCLRVADKLGGEHVQPFSAQRPSQKEELLLNYHQKSCDWFGFVWKKDTANLIVDIFFPPIQ